MAEESADIGESFELGAVGNDDIEYLADEAPDEDATPDDSMEIAVAILKMKEMAEKMRGTNPQWSTLLDKQVRYYDAAATILSRNEDLERKYGYGMKAVKKVAVLLRQHIKRARARNMFTKGNADVIRDLTEEKAGTSATE